MSRRYNDYPPRRRRRTEYRRRSVFMKPSVQIMILVIVGFVVYIILQAGGK